MYLNEFDAFAAQWLRELMATGHLPAGTVDERSITDVAADDVRGHRECHWFAGIGGWPLALRLAGWPAERPVWTGSCPCQPYSSAGRRKGNADERDLWPVFARLIRECRPQCVFGEQVEGAVRFGWLDRVCADLEAEGYTVGACVLGAHSVGAPHQRQRLYWVASRLPDSERERAGDTGPGSAAGAPGGVQGADGERERVRPDSRKCRRVVFQFDERNLESLDKLREQGRIGDDVLRVADILNSIRGVGDSGGDGRQPRPRPERQLDAPERAQPFDLASVNGGAVWGHWRDAIGIDCRDGKRRRVPAQPGVLGVADGLPSPVGRSGVPCATRYPLAGKSPNRAARLRGYGNAICVQTAAAFVRAFLEAEGELA